MNKITRIAVAVALLGNLGIGSAATPKEECVSLVNKAGEFLAANGKDKLMLEINKQKAGMFAHDDIYLFASDFIPNWDSNKDRTITLAHGANPKLVGKDMTDLKDSDGFAFVKRMGEVAASKQGEGWTDYKWPNPVTKQIEQKSTFTKRINNVVVNCGVYK